MLIHAGGGSKHSAPHVRHTHHFQQALNRTILAIGAVQHRQYRVHMAKGGQHMVHSGSDMLTKLVPKPESAELMWLACR